MQAGPAAVRGPRPQRSAADSAAGVQPLPTAVGDGAGGGDVLAGPRVPEGPPRPTARPAGPIRSLL